MDWNPPYQSQITEFFVLNLVKQFTSLLWCLPHWFWSSSTNVQMSQMSTVIQYTKEFPTKHNPENTDWFCFEFVAKSKNFESWEWWLIWLSPFFNYQASNGLVKPGRELEHYPHHDSVPSVSHDKCSVIKTEFAGRPCILKVICTHIAGKDYPSIIIHSSWLRQMLRLINPNFSLGFDWKLIPCLYLVGAKCWQRSGGHRNSEEKCCSLQQCKEPLPYAAGCFLC